MNAGLETADLPSGYRFGNYLILDPIGRGGMARVYRAEHCALHKRVALKLMDHALHDQTAAHRQFLREGRAAAAVKHPNIVDITDVGVWQGIPYLVMELLEGCDLETQLQERGPMSDGEIARLALPIISGLAVAHDAGVVHRDLKPSNIFLAKGADGEQVPKVLDFGISKLARDAADLTATPYGTLLGTPMYLPPEALRGAHALTPASDQYSLGVVLYECAVGVPPFQYDSLVNLLQRIGAGVFDPPSRSRPDISALVERAIVRAMHPDPRQRFPHVRDLGRALWEVASPRTQVLWARAFGPPGEATSEVGFATRRSPVPGARPLPALPEQGLTHTRQGYSSAPQAPPRPRSKIYWLVGAAALGLGAVATTVLPLGVGSRVEYQSQPLQTNALAAPAGAVPSNEAPAAELPAPSSAQSPALLPAADLGAQRAPPTSGFESAAVEAATSREPASREPRARPRSRPASSGQPSRGALAPAAQPAAPALGGPGLADGEPPRPLRSDPAKTPRPGANPRGANESPLLD